MFQPTHPVWGATSCSPPHHPGSYNFNPRTPCGVRRLKEVEVHDVNRDFNPRTPCGVRPPRPRRTSISCIFQSTHPVWGATNDYIRLESESAISIHAPRVGCDSWTANRRYHRHNFNPRTPCGVRPCCSSRYTGVVWNFNPRTPCGVRRGKDGAGARIRRISIHAPRVGCDSGSSEPSFEMLKFQSTHPVWGATFCIRCRDSMHLFQSTHPVWDATSSPNAMVLRAGISIHAPRVGCDRGISVYSEAA